MESHHFMESSKEWTVYCGEFIMLDEVGQWDSIDILYINVFGTCNCDDFYLYITKPIISINFVLILES